MIAICTAGRKDQSRPASAPGALRGVRVATPSSGGQAPRQDIRDASHGRAAADLMHAEGDTQIPSDRCYERAGEPRKLIVHRTAAHTTRSSTTPSSKAWPCARWATAGDAQRGLVVMLVGVRAATVAAAARRRVVRGTRRCVLTTAGRVRGWPRHGRLADDPDIDSATGFAGACPCGLRVSGEGPKRVRRRHLVRRVLDRVDRAGAVEAIASSRWSRPSPGASEPGGVGVGVGAGVGFGLALPALAAAAISSAAGGRRRPALAAAAALAWRRFLLAGALGVAALSSTLQSWYVLRRRPDLKETRPSQGHEDDAPASRAPRTLRARTR